MLPSGEIKLPGGGKGAGVLFDRTSERIKTRHLFIQIFGDMFKIANEIL